LQSVKKLSYSPVPPLSSTIPDNFSALVYIGHRSYFNSVTRNYEVFGFFDNKD